MQKEMEEQEERQEHLVLNQSTLQFLERQRDRFFPETNPFEFRELFREAVQNRDNVAFFENIEDKRTAAFLYMLTRGTRVENGEVQLERNNAIKSVTRMRYIDRGIDINRFVTMTNQQKQELSQILGQEYREAARIRRIAATPRLIEHRRQRQERREKQTTQHINVENRFDNITAFGGIVAPPQGTSSTRALVIDAPVRVRATLANGQEITADVNISVALEVDNDILDSARLGDQDALRQIRSQLNRAMSQKIKVPGLNIALRQMLHTNGVDQRIVSLEYVGLLRNRTNQRIMQGARITFENAVSEVNMGPKELLKRLYLSRGYTQSSAEQIAIQTVQRYIKKKQKA